MLFSGVNRLRGRYLWRPLISRGKSVPRLKSSPAAEINGGSGKGRARFRRLQRSPFGPRKSCDPPVKSLDTGAAPY
jgi:hypothetical protein